MRQVTSPLLHLKVTLLPLNLPSSPWTAKYAVNHHPGAHVTVHTPSPVLKRSSSLRKLTGERGGGLPFTSSPTGEDVSFDTRISCASSARPGSSDGGTLTGYRSWRRSVAVKQRPPCLRARVCSSCVRARYKESARERGRAVETRERKREREREKEGGRKEGCRGVCTLHNWWTISRTRHTEHTEHPVAHVGEERCSELIIMQITYTRIDSCQGSRVHCCKQIVHLTSVGGGGGRLRPKRFKWEAIII